MSRSRTKKKVKDLYAHTARAIKDRYHFDLTEDHYQELCRKIKNNEATLVFRQTNSRSIWKVNNPFDPHKDIYLVYNNNLGAVCTALMRYMVEQIIKGETSNGIF